jgi:hypothetical protein
VGVVRKIHRWDAKRVTAQVDFPHRMECHYLHCFERVSNADRTIAILKHGMVFGPVAQIAGPVHG